MNLTEMRQKARAEHRAPEGYVTRCRAWGLTGITPERWTTLIAAGKVRTVVRGDRVFILLEDAQAYAKAYDDAQARLAQFTPSSRGA